MYTYNKQIYFFCVVKLILNGGGVLQTGFLGLSRKIQVLSEMAMNIPGSVTFFRVGFNAGE